MNDATRERLRAKGAAFQPSARSRVGQVFRTLGVRDGAEFRRIAGLPRRTLDLDHGERLAADLSASMRTASGAMALRPIQALALEELYSVGGLAAPIRVGGGKTLISLLAGEVLEARRPLLVVPAKLREKTRREFRALAEHWHVSTIPEVVSYELLGREQAAAMLEEIAPDLVILDEAHRVKNPKAAVTRRVRRYLDGRPACRVVAMSGTLTQRSIAECAHLFEWALAERSPLPRKFADVVEWGLAVDERLPAAAQRLDPGALRQLYDAAEARASVGLDEVPAVRSAVYRRIVDTAGVVGTSGGGCTSTLTISIVPVDDYGPEVDGAFATLRERWETPDGHPVADAASKWRHACELASGFYYRWNPRPPAEWLTARREWSATVRHILDHNRSELDSELQVARAVARGDYDGTTIRSNGIQIGRETARATYDAWIAIRDTFVPETESVWIDDAIVRAVRAWSATPGIVWVSQVALGERLADVLDLPYFGKKGLDNRKRLIDTVRPEHGSIVASIASNAEGRNLQAWNRSLVVGRPLSGGEWEQLLGRTHRDGQEADEVTIDLLVGCREQHAGFGKALEQAAFAQGVNGQPQKLLIADRIDPFVDGLPLGPRWADG